MCAFPGCDKPVWPSFEWCGKSHGREGERLRAAGALQTQGTGHITRSSIENEWPEDSELLALQQTINSGLISAADKMIFIEKLQVSSHFMTSARLTAAGGWDGSKFTKEPNWEKLNLEIAALREQRDKALAGPFDSIRISSLQGILRLITERENDSSACSVLQNVPSASHKLVSSCFSRAGGWTADIATFEASPNWETLTENINQLLSFVLAVDAGKDHQGPLTEDPFARLSEAPLRMLVSLAEGAGLDEVKKDCIQGFQICKQPLVNDCLRRAGGWDGNEHTFTGATDWSRIVLNLQHLSALMTAWRDESPSPNSPEALRRIGRNSERYEKESIQAERREGMTLEHRLARMRGQEPLLPPQDLSLIALNELEEIRGWATGQCSDKERSTAIEALK